MLAAASDSAAARDELDGEGDEGRFSPSCKVVEAADPLDGVDSGCVVDAAGSVCCS